MLHSFFFLVISSKILVFVYLFALFHFQCMVRQIGKNPLDDKFYFTC